MIKPVETPTQMAQRLMEEISTNPRTSYNKGEVKSILNAISQAEGVREFDFIESDVVRRGDVFAATMVGGKIRPWVCLRVNGSVVLAMAMSKSGTCVGATASLCRYWPNNYLGMTVSAFDVEEVRSRLIRPFTNSRQLRAMEIAILQAWGITQ